MNITTVRIFSALLALMVSGTGFACDIPVRLNPGHDPVMIVFRVQIDELKDAIWKNDAKAVERILAAEPGILDFHVGVMIFNEAVKARRLSIVKKLLKSFKDDKSRINFIKTKNTAGDTPLHIAAEYVCCDIAKELLAVFGLDQVARTAYVNTIDRSGNTPLYRSFLNEDRVFGEYESVHKDFVGLLLAAGADSNPKNIYGATLSLRLQKPGYDFYVKCFGFGSHKFSVSEASVSPLETDENALKLMKAIHGGVVCEEDLVLMLHSIDTGKLSLQDRLQQTLLHYAAQRGYARFANALIERGAPIDAEDYAGMTPLYDAAARGHFRTVKLLLEKGANPHRAAIHGLTPVDIARQRGHRRTMQCFCEVSAGGGGAGAAASE
jgi:ankyrin repeat protein